MPKRVDHDERRDEVAAVAERLIAERGLEVGVLDVARAGGWSSSVVTHYFASKRELLEHTMRRSLERASQAADARVAAGQSRLQAIIEETLPLDASRRRRARLFLVFWGRAVHDATLLEHQRRRHVRFRSTLAALLEAELGSDRAAIRSSRRAGSSPCSTASSSRRCSSRACGRHGSRSRS